MKKEQFDRARTCGDPGVLVHLVCNEADGIFYSDDPDALSESQQTVLCVETFFGAMCDGGLEAWFELDHGELAHCAPSALRRVGLSAYALIADEALRLHCQEALPTTAAGWGEHLGRIRSRHAEEDHTEAYAALEAEFFALCQDKPCEFRQRLFDFIVEREPDLVS